MNNTCATCMWWNHIDNECYADEPGTENCWTNPFDEDGRSVMVRRLERKMWNAFYKAEDKHENEYVGTENNSNWFMYWRVFMQEGFEIALNVVVEELEAEESDGLIATNHDDAERICFTCANGFVDDDDNIVCVLRHGEHMNDDDSCEKWN